MKATIKAERGMNLRAGPGQEYPIIGWLQAGDWIMVQPNPGQWAQTTAGAGYLWVGTPDWVELDYAGQVAPVLGVDVSHWQGNIDWRVMIQEQGVRVAYIKVSQGTSYIDQWWRENHRWARAYGIKVGPYHFFDNKRPAGAQARHFLAQYSSVMWDMPPAGDFEERVDAFNIPDNVKTFLEESGCGVVYTSATWWKQYVKEQDWADGYKLWVAQYEVARPDIPAGWDTWWGWQYKVTDEGAAYGVQSEHLDLDWFRI